MSSAFPDPNHDLVGCVITIGDLVWTVVETTSYSEQYVRLRSQTDAHITRPAGVVRRHLALLADAA